MEEEFKIINGFEKYEISNLGNVRNIKTGKSLKQQNCQGYKIVNIGKSMKRVHILVGNAFIPNPNNHPIIDHINNDRSDNRIENLRWVNHSQNIQNASKRSDNKSGFRGIHYDKYRKMYRVEITKDKKQYDLGYFILLDDAVKRRIRTANKFFGEYLHKDEKELLEILNRDRWEFKRLINKIKPV